MRAALLATASLSAGLVAAQGTQSAPVIKGNPSSASFEAKLPAEAFTAGSLNGNIKGSIKASTPADGVGVEFKVQFENLPKEGGPFVYHIHEEPVPADGNCTKTLTHLDPYKRGEDPPCEKSRPETCQVGDLSGKHGKPNSNTTTFIATYVDPFLSTSPESNAFFGNRSFVIHFANKTRITCANFESIGAAAPVGPSTGGGESSANSTSAGSQAAAASTSTGSQVAAASTSTGGQTSSSTTMASTQPSSSGSSAASTGSSSSANNPSVTSGGDAALSTLSMSLTMLSMAAAFALVF
ncbi:hypothetical protein CDD80_5283 [Ophiocordyceps camponoti-rufipedis]|uniref:superoxide dismutase n=1 Tax=Ophiocordyceps camponoti-rufipedis TaxID=2004952 RepID=A0A2C5YWZ8_9HYPO|nr:hypothetical protein CDD80_5283 [Ophiocordyceps camponoti-rufipedis]